MRKIFSSLSVLAIPAALLLSGCATHTGTGALAGGGLGALAGAAIGGATGHAGEGAAIGAGLGAATGGLVGAGMDENDRRNADRVAAATAVAPSGPMSIHDVVYMAKSGVHEDTIISSIRSSDSVFRLTSADIVDLRNQGVSDRTIQVMLATADRPVVVRRRPRVVYEPAPVYVEPAPVHIGFGYHYCRPWRHRHHCW